MDPANINDAARGMMAAIAKYRDDMSGVIVTGGVVNFYTVASFQGFDSLVDMDGKAIAFTPHVTSTGACQLNVDGFGLKGLRPSPGVDFVGGELVQGTPQMAVFNNADGIWYVHGIFASPFNVPLLGGMDHWDTVAPSSAFIFPLGQAISRTTFPKAFAKWGTRFGSGDGATTFNVPDKSGRVSAMLEAVATRLTAAEGGVDGSNFGGSGGGQTKTLVTANLPPYTPAGSNGSVTVNTNQFVGITSNPSSTGGGAFSFSFPGSFSTVTSTGSGPTFTGTAAPGQNSTPLSVIPPLIVCNYVIRVL
jgi:microcystin-dependent protein